MDRKGKRSLIRALETGDCEAAEPFTKGGYPDIQKYAISFYKKECMVKKGNERIRGKRRRRHA